MTSVNVRKDISVLNIQLSIHPTPHIAVLAITQAMLNLSLLVSQEYRIRREL